MSNAPYAEGGKSKFLHKWQMNTSKKVPPSPGLVQVYNPQHRRLW